MKKRQGGLLAAVLAIGVAGGVGVAGADQRATDHAVYAHDANGSCYSTSDTVADCVGVRADLDIATGDSVTWHITPPNTTAAHNAAGANDEPNDPTWKDYASDFTTNGTITRTFAQPGSYDFVCNAHPSMVGTITVTGDPTGTPTPTPTATPTPTPTTHPGGSTTPPPTPIEDAVKPTVRRLKLKALRHAARVTFRLSEPSTVTIRVKRGRKVVKSKRLQVAAGTRTVTVKKLRKGRYTIVVLARDAFGNRSVAASRTLRIKR
jgi:plastocyanin